MSLISRFLSKIEIVTETGCWIWVGGTKDGRYGAFWLAGKMVTAHRLAVEMLQNRRLGPEDVVLHRCDVTFCCNPAHLQVGTQSDNIQDCVAKGRWNEFKPRTPNGDDFCTEEEFDEWFN